MLTLGSGGITQSAANGQAFRTVQVLLGADQTWKLANGAGALTFAAGLDTSGGPGGAGRALTIATHKTPKTIELLDGLPRNANGKVLKKTLRERHAAGGAG